MLKATRLLPALLALACALAAPAAAQVTARPTQTIRVPGLGAPVEILVDRWGVPHIYAKSQDDVFFAQGFNAARDRLFQIDLWRRRGLGQLAEVFGPAYVEQDRATRLFLYRGDMYREWLAYGPDAKRTATSFVAGINAYLDYLKQNPSQLPVEFREFGYEPARWQPEDVVRIRTHGLTRNLTSEVDRARVACAASLAEDTIRVGLEPSWRARMPEGLDPCLPADVLKLFSLATAEVHIAAGSPRAALAEPAGDDGGVEGSNNWVIAPARTASGRPILANDPHRAYATPSLRYISHLSAPGIDAIGAGEPVSPGIAIGHNQQIGFGLTVFAIDQEDLYVYQLNGQNPGEYRYQDRWEPMRTVREEIRVRGAAPVPVELSFTRHGPVIYLDREKGRAYAVRSAWMEPGMSPYLASIGYLKARSWDQFLAAIDRWGAPTLNHVYADVAGNIGWTAGGLAPIRRNWDGLLPVPGDGRYEWEGFFDRDQLPSRYNPKEGWFSTSNEMNLPAAYPYTERRLGFEWTNSSRHERIEEVLRARPKVTLLDAMRLQMDITSIPARRLGALLRPLSSDDPKTRAALALLRGWDYAERAESPEAALMEVWITRHLGPGFERAVLSPAAAAAIAQPDIAVMLRMLERPGALPAERRDALLLTSLRGAFEEMEKLQGPDPAKWQWGKLQYNLSEHPLAGAVSEALRAKLNVGPFPKSGGPYTPNQSTYRLSDFRHTLGPSFRMVLDVGAWDESRAVNYPGQSGDPDSPHYRDLAPLWLAGDYFPLVYSRAAVERATEKRIVLTPG